LKRLTLLAFHQALVQRQYRMLFSPKQRTQTKAELYRPGSLYVNETRFAPPIRVVSRFAVIVPSSEPLLDGAQVLGPGYHRRSGGILVTGLAASQQVPIGEAVAALQRLLVDFLFQTAGDESRAIAALLTPPLRMGGLDPGKLPNRCR
jgi:hypothetical protein